MNGKFPPWEIKIFHDKLLGEGSFGKVYLAKWRKTLVVAKVSHKHLEESNKNLIKKEFDIMTKMHHPNIVQLFGYIDEPFTIVMEYFPKGNLNNQIKNISNKTKIKIIKDISKGLIFLHNRRPNNIMHRDIKPTNILLTNSLTAKICDFGIAKLNLDTKYKVTSSLNSKLNELESIVTELTVPELTVPVGTNRYMAPEILKDLVYDKSVDIYSFGILIYELFENKKYIPSTNGNLNFFWTPTKYRKFIRNNMLNLNPNDRPDSYTIYNTFNT